MAEVLDRYDTNEDKYWSQFLKTRVVMRGTVMHVATSLLEISVMIDILKGCNCHK